jgi:hypothetical protein
VHVESEPGDTRFTVRLPLYEEPGDTEAEAEPVVEAEAEAEPADDATGAQRTDAQAKAEPTDDAPELSDDETDAQRTDAESDAPVQEETRPA